MSRVTFCIAWIGGFLVCGLADSPASDTILPEKIAPAPIVSGHFPDRVHAFV